MIGKKFVAPALSVPPLEYDQLQQTDLIRQLRLYFNLLDDYIRVTILDALNGGVGGNGITFPHIAASDSTNQYALGNDTPTVVAWDTLEAGYLWTLNAPGSAVADVAGVYRITYSLEFANTANDVHNVVVWLRVNGDDIPNSATYFSVRQRKSAGVPSYLCAYSEITFPIAVGDEIELVWATDLAYVASPLTDGIYMLAIAAQTVPYKHPAVPSAVGSITYVSAIPPA